MVFERLIAPWKLEKHPLEIFLVTAFYANVAIITSLTIFRKQASLVSVLFAVVLCLPFVYYLLVNDEKKFSALNTEYNLLKSHGRTTLELMMVFLGIVATFTAWHMLAPESVTNHLFSAQYETITNIQSSVTGKMASMETVSLILTHNMKIFVVTTLLSFFFGTGAIFILSWNASVLSAALGAKFKAVAAAGTALAYPLAYLIHAIPEVLAYIIGGVLGGMISVAIINKDISIAQLGKIGKDSMVLIVLAFVILILAAHLEVFVSPIFLH